MCVTSVATAEEPVLDLGPWQHIPVFRGGRVMPLDTFARSAAEIVCNRVNPTLSLEGISADELKSQEFAGALELFPEGKPRKWRAPELLLSWLTEPAHWEQVPFLIAEYDELRDLLGIPVMSAEKTHLKYVSPAVVAESDKLRSHLEKMQDAQRAAKMSGERPELSSLDKKAKELFDAFTFYRQLTFNPQKHDGARSRFLQQASEVLKGWGKLDDDLAVLRTKQDLNETITRIDSALQALAQAAGSGRFPLDTVEPSVVIVNEALGQLSTECTKLKTQIFKAKEGEVPGFDKEHLDAAKVRLNRLAAAVRLLARQSKEMHIALYDNTLDDNHDALRVVPALNAASLDRDRDPEDASQPWLTLQTVLYGSPELLKDYPQAQIKAVRATFARLGAAYTDRKASDRAKAVVDAENEFAADLRNLGIKTTALRDKLEIAHRDDDLLKYTAYPAVGLTDMEVTYNRSDPFLWSWVFSLMALVAFALAFGVIRKPMFWLGLAVLAVGLGWTAYGFYLRVMVTHWAPVTNMYETVVYVPFFVSLLGAWFTLLPITWPGLQQAWKLTAVPGTWEAAGDDEDPLPENQFSLLKLLVLVPRIALMVLVFQMLAIHPYAAGGRTIINLKPVVDVGAKLPDLNNTVVWVVGMCVLLPAVWFIPRLITTLAVSLFTITSTFFKQGATLLDQIYVRKPFGLAATFAAFLGAFVAWYSPVLDKNFTPLQPVLRDNFWLTIHVLTIVSSYGAGMLAWGLGNLSLSYFLFGKYRTREPLPVPKSLASGYRPAVREELVVEPEATAERLPPTATHTLAAYVYKVVQVAVLLLAAGTILGGLWADVSWGRFWGWDPKEVWALVSLLTYLALLHGRYAGWFGDFGMAAGSVLGATSIAMSWYGVNFVLGVGLHSYGFGENGKGQAEVFSFVALNWLFLGAAAFRYLYETRTKPPSPPHEDKESEKPNRVEVGSRE